MADVRQYTKRKKAPSEVSSAPIKSKADRKRKRKIKSWIAGFGNLKTVEERFRSNSSARRPLVIRSATPTEIRLARLAEIKSACIARHSRETLWLHWLERLKSGPVRRDGNGDAIPFDVATELLAEGLIMSDREYSEGIARASCRVWRISDDGRRLISEMALPGGTGRSSYCGLAGRE